ncbi:hypothetical protein KMB28_20045, partial [Streptomyces sp. CBG30]|nr:hypothetical protein [Streptomyces sp. CBG30]
MTPEDDMVIRPRLYEADPHTMRVPLDRILGPAGVRRTTAAVTAIDTARRTLTAVDRTGGAREIAYERSRPGHRQPSRTPGDPRAGTPPRRRHPGGRHRARRPSARPAGP